MAGKSLFRFIWEYFKVNLQSAMEYRVSFIMQVVFMFLNDVIWIIFWMIFFNKFPYLFCVILNHKINTNIGFLYFYKILTTSQSL